MAPHGWNGDQFGATPPPGLAPARTAVDSASLEVWRPSGVGPYDIVFETACETGWTPRSTGRGQDKPAFRRGESVIEAVSRFKARSAYALRQLRKEAPEVGERCRLQMAQVMTLAEGHDVGPTPAQRLTPPPGLSGGQAYLPQ